MSFARAGWTVGIALAVSRILGFIRDILIAGVLGAGPIADAFLVAFRIPNAARRVLGEGGMNAGFVPLHAAISDNEGKQAAWAFSQRAIVLAAVLLLAVTGIAELCAGIIVQLLAAGFEADADKMALAILYTRLALPFIAFAGLASLIAAVLNAERHFVASAIAPVLVNLMMIAALLVLPTDNESAEKMGAVLSITLSLSGVVHLVVVGIALWRLPYRFAWKWPRIDCEMVRLSRFAMPAFLASATTQAILLMAMIVASMEPSAVSWLYYADRVFQLPLSFVGVAAGIVLLPHIAARHENTVEGNRNALMRMVEGALALSLPACVALVILGGPIATVLFERGAFGAEDSAATAAVLATMATGLPGAVLAKVLAQPFFAHRMLRAPLLAGLAGLAVTGFAAFSLVEWLGIAGVGLGASLGLWTQAIVLWVAWRAIDAKAFDRAFLGRVVRLLLAALLMGLCVHGVALFMSGALPMDVELTESARAARNWLAAAQPIAVKGGALAVICLGGMLIYGIAGRLLGVIDWGMLRRGL